MQRRHVTSAITLLVLVGILVAGVLIGMNALFAPLPDDGTAAASPSPTCKRQTFTKGKRVRSSQVQVSVFNGSGRAGLADQTMRALARRGFLDGTTSNAPEGMRVTLVRVVAQRRGDQAARLVARQFGPGTKVTVARRDLGPGVDVILGAGYRRLAAAPKSVVANRTTSVCVPVPSPSSDLG